MEQCITGRHALLVEALQWCSNVVSEYYYSSYRNHIFNGVIACRYIHVLDSIEITLQLDIVIDGMSQLT